MRWACDLRRHLLQERDGPHGLGGRFNPEVPALDIEELADQIAQRVYVRLEKRLRLFVKEGGKQATAVLTRTIPRKHISSMLREAISAEELRRGEIGKAKAWKQRRHWRLESHIYEAMTGRLWK